MLLLRRTQVLINYYDLHAVLSICAIVLLIMAIFGTFGRIYTKIAVERKLPPDDQLACLALILCGAQTAATLIASGNGLGQHWTALTDAKRKRYEIAVYSANLLYLLTIILAKLSVVLLIRSLVPFSLHLRIGIVYAGAVLAWGAGSGIAAVFQCKMPNVWNPQGNPCINRLMFWNCLNLLNILTDGFLVVWPSLITYNLHAKLSRRLATIGFFACRLLVIGATITQMILENEVSESSDPSFHMWRSTLCIQVVQALSITMACIPYLRGFLESLESGRLRSKDLRPTGPKSADGHTNQKSQEHRPLVMTANPLQGWVNAENSTKVEAEGPQWDAECSSSQARTIKHTISWAPRAI